MKLTTEHIRAPGVCLFWTTFSTLRLQNTIWTQKCMVHCLMVGLMFDYNDGPQNFPILAHSINIYYWWSRYENIGSKNSGLHCLYAWHTRHSGISCKAQHYSQPVKSASIKPSGQKKVKWVNGINGENWNYVCSTKISLVPKISPVPCYEKVEIVYSKEYSSENCYITERKI